jgi:hypothetical protein
MVAGVTVLDSLVDAMITNPHKQHKKNGFMIDPLLPVGLPRS